MDTLTIIIIAVVVIAVLVLLFWFIAIYNRFYSLKNAASATLGQIKVAMKKRLDQIEQLLGAVQSYAKCEKATLESVPQMRASVMGAGTNELRSIDAESRKLFGNILAVAENYPDLKANRNVASLQEELTGTENKISFARQFYNDSVMRYDIKRQTFPSNLVAGMFHFVDREYFQTAEAEKAAPQVKF